MLPSYAVMLDGKPGCPCLVAWYSAFKRELGRRGWIVGSFHIYQLIGGAPESGGTHVEGGAGDDNQVSDNAIWLARQMGADASWHRPFNWDGRGGIAHAHRVLRGCPHNGPARYQYDSTTQGVDHGRDGLSHGGRGAPDTGPRPLSGRTWQQGIEWARQQEETDDMTPDQDARLKRIEKMLTNQAKLTKKRLQAIADQLADDATQGQIKNVRRDLAALADELTTDEV